MNKIFAVSMLCMVLCGCASSGRIGELPASIRGGPSSELVLIRPSNLTGVTNSYYISLDGRDVFSIRSGEYTKFPVPTGTHAVSVKCFGGWSPTWKEESTQFNAAPGQSYYYRISPSFSCAKIVQIDAEDAMKLLATNSFVSPNNISDSDKGSPASSSDSALKTTTVHSDSGLSSAPKYPAASGSVKTSLTPPTVAPEKLVPANAIPAAMPAEPIPASELSNDGSPATVLPPVRRQVAGGVETMVAAHAHLASMCGMKGPTPLVRVLDASKHGATKIKQGEFVAPGDHESDACPSGKVYGTQIYYQPDAGFYGTDHIRYSVIAATGQFTREVDIEVK